MNIGGLVWAGCVDMGALVDWDGMECEHGFWGETGWGGHG